MRRAIEICNEELEKINKNSPKLQEIKSALEKLIMRFETDQDIHEHNFIHFSRSGDRAIRICGCGFAEQALNMNTLEPNLTKTNYKNPKIKWEQQ